MGYVNYKAEFLLSIIAGLMNNAEFYCYELLLKKSHNVFNEHSVQFGF